MGCVKGSFSPNERLFIQRTAHRERNPACGWSKSRSAGRNPHFVRSKFVSRWLTNDEAPKPFQFRGFIYPGSYLLSRDLSSDYHRRADVSLPGSEWDRVGPSGYDHQVSGSGLFFRFLPTWLSSALAGYCAVCWLPCGSRLTSAWLACLL